MIDVFVGSRTLKADEMSRCESVISKATLVILFAVKLRSTTCDDAYGNAFVNRLDCYFIFG